MNMTRFIQADLVGIALFALSSMASAQVHDPYYGSQQNGQYGNSRNHGSYGGDYSGNSGNIVDRVSRNLAMAAANSRVDGHEQGHFNTAQRELANFQQRWAQGRFDTGRLDRAIGAMNDLANSNQVRPGDRQMLASDLAALRSFRASGGQGYGTYGSYNGEYNPYNGSYYPNTGTYRNGGHRNRGAYRDHDDR